MLRFDWLISYGGLLNSISSFVKTEHAATVFIMDIPPTLWGVQGVENWARAVKLSEATIAALAENEIDGPTLITLSRDELSRELGIRSLSSRRFLWEALLKLRSQQNAEDCAVAVAAHTSEIENLSKFSKHSLLLGDRASMVGDYAAVVQFLQSDAAKQRQLVDDHLLAHRLGFGQSIGEQVCEDAQYARREQIRLDELLIQTEFDHRFAASVSPNNANRASSRHPESLFSLCLDICVKNKINVSEALVTGRICVRSSWRHTLHGDASPDAGGKELENRMSRTKFNAHDLPRIEKCVVCFDEDIPGIELACEHTQCVGCMKQLLQTALKDVFLLPLVCCEIPIDLSVTELLTEKQANQLKRKMEETTATKKMYCPVCGEFINLDFAEGSCLVGVSCDCGTALCVVCQTVEHPTVTCAQNKVSQLGSDQVLLDLAAERGWKQCPQCDVIIEFISGCNHMACANCKHDFCYRCLLPWNTKKGLCSSGKCQVWEEELLEDAAENRVRGREQNAGAVLPRRERQQAVARERAALLCHEFCDHEWDRDYINYASECERCGFDLYVYGMVCRSGCRSTVCYTCAHHRIPRRGWR